MPTKSDYLFWLPAKGWHVPSSSSSQAKQQLENRSLGEQLQNLNAAVVLRFAPPQVGAARGQCTRCGVTVIDKPISNRESEAAMASSSVNHLNPFISYIANDQTDEKLKDLFEFYDIDGNGMIQRQELIEVLSLCAHEIGLDVEPFLEQIADAVFSNANLNQSGSITFEALKEVLKSRPNLTNELLLAKALHQQKADHSRANQQKQHSCHGMRTFLANSWDLFASKLATRIPIFNKLRLEYISNNLTRFNFSLSIVLTTLALTIGRIITYWNVGGPFLIIARCAGQCLNFLCSIVVLLVCRRTISHLRSRGLSRYLPLDDHIYFHKLIGLMIVLHSLVHTFGHVLNFLIQSQQVESKFSYAEYLFSTRPGIGWLFHCASLTGWLLLFIIAAMSLAQPFSRSLGKFELFYYTHLLYIPFWVLLFIHAPNFWIWFLGPFVIFLSETMLRLRNLLTNLTESGQTTIIKAIPLPSDVLHLVIKRPANFEYKPGDWIYVLIPHIAKYEWHPFTISSAPEQEGVIWLHIRAVGEWTKSLRAYFENNAAHRNHLRRFIKSGQFSMSMDQQQAANLPHTITFKDLSSGSSSNTSSSSINELSVSDSSLSLANSRARADKLSRFKHKGPSLAPIPEAIAISAETSAGGQQSAAEKLANLTQETTLDSFKSSSGDSDDTKQVVHHQQRVAAMSGCEIKLKNFAASSSGSSSVNSSVTSLVSTGSTDSGVSSTSQRLAKLPSIQIFIDGPYGSPSSQIFRAEHAVLIATGIGVTPFASILQSIVYHYEKRRQKCPNCLHEFSDTRSPIVCKLRKVDFVWINRDQKSFEWFIKLLAELELTQSHLPPQERFLDIHIHLTAMEPAKTKSIGLQLALYLVHEKNKKDLVTGLRTRTKAGRPDWDDFFADIREQKKGKVSVFFCGRPQLGRILHRQCDSFGFKFRKEIF